MRAFLFSRALTTLSITSTFFACSAGFAEPVKVRHTQGLEHGFLILRDTEDKIIGEGDLLQVARGSHVTASLTLRFKDGSLHEETAVFTQRQTFQLLTYHMVEKGPWFKHAVDLSMNVPKGSVLVHDTDDNGKQRQFTEHLKLPNDLANGFLTTLILDVDPESPKTTVSMVVASPKPRVVKLNISPAGESPYTVVGLKRKALQYDIKIDLGGFVGLVAPLIGKQPPDIRIWITPGQAPGFLKVEGALYDGGPILRAELASPIWSKTTD